MVYSSWELKEKLYLMKANKFHINLLFVFKGPESFRNYLSAELLFQAPGNYFPAGWNICPRRLEPISQAPGTIVQRKGNQHPNRAEKENCSQRPSV